MNGILLVDKPRDWTSMDVCAKLRGLLREKKIGHSGTLDPMATGLLTVFAGRATRAAEYAEAGEKTYLASLRLGLVTDTQDVWGRTLSESPGDVSDSDFLRALEGFRGEISQIPPMYSAIKVKGQKLYDIARKGGTVERAPRPVTIRELEWLGRDSEGDMLLRIRCGKGTYIRTLCHDIGAALGCGGCMASLRRLASGPFDVSSAHSLEEIAAAAEEGRAEELMLPTDALFADCPKAVLSAAQERSFKNGVRYTCGLAEGRYRLYSERGEFLALGRVAEGKMLSVKNFFEVNDFGKS